MRFSMCGDAAFCVELGSRPNVLLTRAIAALHGELMRSAPPGFVESVPGLTALTILFDPDAVSASALQQAISRCLDSARNTRAVSREWQLPVCYAGDYAPDLEDVAGACGLSADAVIETHTARSYVVYLLGFSPGFPYLGDLDKRIVLPRRAEPRPRVPAGSVAIATQYTAVYPQATAGGWHIIGRTPVQFFDAGRNPPALLSPGDSVRFYSVDAARYEAIAAECEAGRYSLTG
jgi:inhibitor of KinA